VIFLFVAIPGLVVAILGGLGLLFLHGRPVWRRRWLRVKLALLAITLPVFHLWTSALVRRLRFLEDGENGAPVMERLRMLLVAAVVTGAVAIVLGRHKPRLGQRVVRG